MKDECHQNNDGGRETTEMGRIRRMDAISNKSVNDSVLLTTQNKLQNIIKRPSEY